MSETVHYKGIATRVEVPSDKTLIDVALEILRQRGVISAQRDEALNYLCEYYTREFFFHVDTQTLYELETNEYEDWEVIIEADRLSDDMVSFELRYYNGGAGFEECLEEAFDKMEKIN